MTQQPCNGCQHKNTCEDVYRRLGSSDAPPVVRKILLAFVLPMFVFLLALAIIERILDGQIHPRWIPLVSSGAAVFVTLMYATIAGGLIRRPRSQKYECGTRAAS